ncbi:AraC family transcriptional regulator [Paenarthrobacter sp. JL.01a]|uniref:AraC family transcriptional regulator n=1 Tax=Paenarthrobacter sp. JL.01a TaxID=2979324 RepID=UPI0021C9DB62|nr:AraC family transcriptional regulator [Paenarthrobacter sp. JL.01a]UXM92511.1 AraC family transcriptional regulator [Paenarthrobacter sp. JL.01a]
MFPSDDELLAGKEVSRSTDFDEFSQALNSHFYPARVQLREPSDSDIQPRLSVSHLRLSTIGLVHFRGRVSVDPGDLGAYHVNVPLHGQVVSFCGQEQVIATPLRAAVFTPGQRTFLPNWDEMSPQWCWKIDRIAVEREMEALLGRSLKGKIDFDLAFDLSSSAGSRWLEGMKLMVDYVNDMDRTPAASHHVENLERTLISGLILTQHHSFYEMLRETGGPVRPRTVRRVMDAIRENPSTPYTLGDLSLIAGISARQLQNSFNDHLGVSPLTYLRNARLDLARELILTSRLPVSDIAMQCGFNHLGKFAKYYRERFGETPSASRPR